MCVSIHRTDDNYDDNFLELLLDKYHHNNDRFDLYGDDQSSERDWKNLHSTYRVNGGQHLVKLDRSLDNQFRVDGQFCIGGYLVTVRPLDGHVVSGDKGIKHFLTFHDEHESATGCLRELREESDEYDDSMDGGVTSDDDDQMSKEQQESLAEEYDVTDDVIDNIEDNESLSQYTISNAFGNFGGTRHGNGRVRRTQHLTIELLMVIDYAAYKWWSSIASDESNGNGVDTMSLIRQFYAYIFQGIDARFRSIETQPYMIDLAFSGLFVAKTEQESFWTYESIIGESIDNSRVMVNSSEALDKFQTWLDNADFLPPYDHAILFTGTNLTYAGSPGNTGLAFESSMCRNISNASIVEDIFDFRTVTYSTQQIARSLGSRDDMDNNNCLEFFNHIMAPKFKLPVKSFVSNRWKFSSCSEQYFLEYTSELTDLGLTCLSDQIGGERYPPDLLKLVEELPGKIYSGKKQCENRFGLSSDICREKIGKSYSDVCGGLLCTLPGSDACDYLLPADGTPCGNKKYCWLGNCLEFDDAIETSDTCVFGNDPNADCDAVTVTERSQCYNETVRNTCCQTCESMQTGLQSCEYGDRFDDCSMSGCVNGDETYKTSSCCLTCADGPTPYAPPLEGGVTDMFSLQQTPTPFNKETLRPSTLSISPTATPSSILHAISSLAAFVQASVGDTLYSAHPESAETTTKSSTDDQGRQVTYANRKEIVQVSVDEYKIGGPVNNPNIETSIMENSPGSQYEDTSAPEQSLVNKETHGTEYEARENGKYEKSVTEVDERSGQMAGRQQCNCTKNPNNVANAKNSNHYPDSNIKCEPANPIEGNGSLYDRIFFKDLARSMQNNQRFIKQSLRKTVRNLYWSVTTKLRRGSYEYETENESGREGGEDEDLNRKLLPIWRQNYHEIMKDIENNVREMSVRRWLLHVYPMEKLKDHAVGDRTFVPHINSASRKIAAQRFEQAAAANGLPQYMSEIKCQSRVPLGPISCDESSQSYEKTVAKQETEENSQQLRNSGREILKPVAMSKQASVMLDDNVFTFRPKLSTASAKIVENMGTDFMARQQQHLEKQKKLIEKAGYSYHNTPGRLSPLSQYKRLKERGFKVEETDNLNNTNSNAQVADGDIPNSPKSDSEGDMMPPIQRNGSGLSQGLQRVLDGKKFIFVWVWADPVEQ
ncbi:Protein monoglycylase ttll8 [Mactra antiquata]